MRNLYLPKPVYNIPSFAKEAAALVPLSEHTESWPEEILREVHKQLPYVADYNLDVEMSRMDAELGYAFGHVTVSGRSEVTPRPGAESFSGVQKVRIPLIVKERKLYPLDTLVTSDAVMLPLTESRLRQALFRPQMFDVTATPPADRSLMSQLYPPYRQNLGAISAGSAGGDMHLVGKMASESSAKLREQIEAALEAKKNAGIPNSSNPKAPAGPSIKQQLQKSASILEAVQSQVPPELVIEVAPLLVGLTEKNAAAAQAVAAITRFEFAPDPEKTASGGPEIDVWQVRQREDGDGYVLKVADVTGGVSESVIDRRQLVSLLGAKIAMEVDTAGAVTGATSEPEAPTDEPEASVITEAGTYKVMDLQGKEVTGLVFPNLLDPAQGKAVPSSLFLNGSITAYQPDIVGVRVGDVTEPPTGEPGGMGAWYIPDGQDGPTMTVPLKVLGHLPGGFLVEKADGEQATVELPPNAKFVPFGQSDTTSLLSSEESAALAKSAQLGVEIRASSSTNIELTPVVGAKEAGARERYDYDGALFELARAGVRLEEASTKIASSLAGNQTTFVAANPRPRQAVAEEKTAAPMASELRRILVKEAEDIPDPQAVDTVLSLGFITPDNEATYMSYLPQLESVQSKLCELLIAARVGLRQVSPTPVEKCVRALEEVIDGLKVIAFRNN
jgi:hypothetical protein